MQTDERRRVLFEGAVNFRDLGGYRAGAGRQTRWGQVYRADNLAGLTEADLIRLEGLGLRTLIDFRLPMEREASPDGYRRARRPARGSGLHPSRHARNAGARQSRNNPGPGDPTAGDGAISPAFVDHTEEYRQTFVVALDPSYPPLLHCTSGEDRTGFAAALLLLALGVSRKTVIEDYNLTNLFRRPVPHLFGPGSSGGGHDNPALRPAEISRSRVRRNRQDLRLIRRFLTGRWVSARPTSPPCRPADRAHHVPVNARSSAWRNAFDVKSRCIGVTDTSFSSIACRSVPSSGRQSCTSA